MDVNKYILDKYNLHGLPSPIRLPEVGRLKLYQLFGELGYKNGAEIGVWAGQNAKQMLQEIPGLKMLLVDPFTNYPYSSRNWKPELMSKLRTMAHKAMRNRNAVFMEMISEDAIRQISDSSLDFVYIDGDHTYDFCMLDMILWYRKVRKGGIMSGHDYDYNERKRSLSKVPAVIDNYTKIHRIEPWFTTDDLRPQRRGDNYPSWFFVKTTEKWPNQ